MNRRVMEALTTAAVCMGVICLAGCSARRPGRVVDLGTGLRALTNVAAFAERPLGTAAMVSTYDRTGGNNDWANLAALVDGDVCVLADLKGPGCVKRIWMTNVPAKEWLFFFDGERTPRLRIRENDLFGKADPFLPPLCDKVSNGSYCYMPLPYAKSLRIAVVPTEIKPDMMAFFHINTETYPRDVKVTSFPAAISGADRRMLDEVRQEWSARGGIAATNTVAGSVVTNLVILPGQTGTWLVQSGGGCLRQFRVSLDTPASLPALARSRRLRELMLRFYWDGSREPSVEVPLGDFFCNGLSPSRFSALPMASLGDAFVCRFPMAFRRGARAEIQNDGATPVSVQIVREVVVADPPEGTDVGYFHAWWNQSAKSGVPHRILRAEGRGHYVGCYLNEIGMDGTWNIFEGDESMYVDGEVTPSLHGTGLEDYFNGAWYYSDLFDLPLHGLVERAPIRSSQYRFHLSDAVAFRKSFTADIEFGHANQTRGYMSSVAYWYQDQPHPAGVRPPVVGQRYPPPDPLEPASIMGGFLQLDRAGRYAEAAERCAALTERFAGTPWADILSLRRLAYREAVQGYAAVSNDYALVVKQGRDPALVEQAKTLMWFHESPTNALLGFHPVVRHVVYLDGQLVGDGDDPASLHVFPVGLAPGEHEIAVELTPTRGHGMLSLYLRAHGTNVISDGQWEYTRGKPASWPRSGDTAAAWKPVEEALYAFPGMAYWQFSPNAYIDMQAGRQLLRPWGGWAGGKETGYLRRRFTIAPAAGKP